MQIPGLWLERVELFADWSRATPAECLMLHHAISSDGNKLVFGGRVLAGNQDFFFFF